MKYCDAINGQSVENARRIPKRMTHSNMTVIEAIRHLQQVGVCLPFRKRIVIAVERALRG